MGDAADDAWDDIWNFEAIKRHVVAALRDDGCRCPDHIRIEMNDDGLWECQGCKRVTDT